MTNTDKIFFEKQFEKLCFELNSLRQQNLITNQKKIKTCKKFIDLHNEAYRYYREGFTRLNLVSDMNRIQKIYNEKQKHFQYWNDNICPFDIPASKRKTYFLKQTGLDSIKKRVKQITELLKFMPEQETQPCTF